MREVKVGNVRTHILILSSTAGDVSMMLVEGALQTQSKGEEDKRSCVLASKILKMITTLIEISCLVSVNLHQACVQKMEMNRKKYPIDLCKVRKTLG